MFCECNDRRWVYYILSNTTPIIRVRVPCPYCNRELLAEKGEAIRLLDARVNAARTSMDNHEFQQFSIRLQREIDNGDLTQ